MRYTSYITNDQKLIQVSRCENIGDGIPMHKHDRNNHTTEVISGRIRIFDDLGWSTELSAGEIIDLHNIPKHEIVALESNTTFHNAINRSEFTEEEIQEMISTPEYSTGRPTRVDAIKRILSTNAYPDNGNLGVVVVADSLGGSEAVLSLIGIESGVASFQLTCPYVSDGDIGAVKVSISVPADLTNLKEVVIYYGDKNFGAGNTVMQFK